MTQHGQLVGEAVASGASTGLSTRERRPGPPTAPAVTVADATKVKPRDRWRLRGFCVALAVLVAINVGLQLDRRTWDVKSDTVAALQKVQACESLGRKPDVLYLGSSRTLYGIDPMEVDSTVATQTGKSVLSCNAGVVGTNFEQDYYTLKRFIEDGYKPKMVVETLWERNINANAVEPMDNRPLNNAQIVNLADAADTPALMQHFGPSKGQQLPGAFDFLFGKAVPLYGDRVGILRSICGGSTVGPCSTDTSQLDANTQKHLDDANKYRGWDPLTSSMAQVLSSWYQSKDTLWYRLFTPEVGHFSIGGHQPEYLAKFIDLARANGVKVSLVETPLHPAYFFYFDHGEADWRMIAAYWRTFADQHGVPFYDESHAPGYTSEDFDDPHHLNAAGARIFSRWLAASVVVPALS